MTIDIVLRAAPPDLAPTAALTALVDAAKRAYETGERAYHNFGHVREVLEQYAEIARHPGWAGPHEVYVALLFHDAVYMAGAADNEVRSAELARRAVATHLPTGNVDADRVAFLIELTQRHGHLNPDDVDSEGALFLDCDMAILAATPARFDAYDAAIAREYADVPSELYLLGRRAFFNGLLAKPRIFLSAHFHEQFDVPARSNLRRAVAALT